MKAYQKKRAIILICYSLSSDHKIDFIFTSLITFTPLPRCHLIVSIKFEEDAEIHSVN